MFSVESMMEQCAFELSEMEPSFLFDNQGSKFERVLYDTAIKVRDKFYQGFSIQIELVSGQKFPDIVINCQDQKIGIEVKTSKSGWKTLGGSIFESTRVDGVEDVYVFFANFEDKKNPQFKYLNMEECISDVVITHKPRYAIDMEVENTLFDKASIKYDAMRKSEAPFKLVRQYLLDKHEGSVDLWWTDNDPNDKDYGQGPQVIKLLNNLPKKTQELVKIEAYALFPELLSNKTTKYQNLVVYLAKQKGIVDASLRDRFSAGGRVLIGGIKSPKYLEFIFSKDNLEAIRSFVELSDTSFLQKIWGVSFPEGKKFETWKKLALAELFGNNQVDDNIVREMEKEYNIS
ncbi:hypothetical protein [Paraferrimonas sp. SM1919]|uniref:hypothetical protein n=1 Tax=Paraferrimonas sp. SM1919 TaxID=2662263 RepID=UPI0013D04532|nr:hypothetical protein [Paraferrimonas sp. SM1919]